MTLMVGRHPVGMWAAGFTCVISLLWLLQEWSGGSSVMGITWGLLRDLARLSASTKLMLQCTEVPRHELERVSNQVACLPDPFR